MAASHDAFNDNDVLDEDFMADSSPQVMQSKMTASEPIPKTGAVTDENGNVDLFGDFGNGAGENGEGNGE